MLNSFFTKYDGHQKFRTALMCLSITTLILQIPKTKWAGGVMVQCHSKVPQPWIIISNNFIQHSASKLAESGKFTDMKN